MAIESTRRGISLPAEATFPLPSHPKQKTCILLYVMGYVRSFRTHLDRSRSKPSRSFGLDARRPVTFDPDPGPIELEDKEPFYSLFVPPRDLRAGKFELDQQLEEVRNSKRVIIIVSQNFIDNEVCMEIFRVAFLSDLEEKHYRIIPIIVGTLPPLSELDPSLKVALQSTKRQRFGQKLLWEMVRFAMPEKSHITEASEIDDDIDMPLLNAW
ncbi:hypothetical protein AVEN_271532-1 [Araneus ventricosus]|uniref:TIR domain-containing protein n=1 Tax=Araneus ventricosus TaxID=182803 RepID=A0A4Y2FZZ2_ARAVE|nr:hypothetical protein AVEN_271532-1 [Araneus ventricosus]